MSDIGLRLDGLILLLAIFVSGAFYAVATIAALLTAWLSIERQRVALRMARRSAILTLFCAAAETAAGVYVEQVTPPTNSPDVVDWLTVPWLALAVGGCIWMIQARRAQLSK